MHTGDSIARSQIVEKDRELSIKHSRLPGRFHIGTRVANGGMVDWIVCADADPLKISFDLTPESVIKMIREKSFTIAGVEDAELLQAVKEALIGAERDGTDFVKLRANLKEVFASYGVEAPGYNHLQVVFRTNAYSSYSLAQLSQIGEMPDRFPMWRYFAILDDRTRPLHRELNGRYFRIGEGPIPPIDYNCRCTAQYMHTSELTPDMKPEDWKGNKGVKLDVRKSFDQYLKDHQDSLTPALKSWIKSSK